MRQFIPAVLGFLFGSLFFLSIFGYIRFNAYQKQMYKSGYDAGYMDGTKNGFQTMKNNVCHIDMDLSTMKKVWCSDGK